MAEAVRGIDPSPRLYGIPPHNKQLVRLMTRELNEVGLAAGSMCVVSGALEGIDRVMAEHLRPGDRVAVEDPGFTGILDLLTARGLSLVPVAMDDQGMLPQSLHDALRCGARALVVTPRVQSPTGAALTANRAAELRRELAAEPNLLIVHDDHARLITDSPLHCLHMPKCERWAYVHSFSKALNPDLRLAVITGDDTTMSRVSHRMLATERWVSHILQQIALRLLSDQTVRRSLIGATATYDTRRRALLDELAERGIDAHGESGFNVWVRVREETATVQGLASAGWAVSPGERYRLRSGPGIRVTASRLHPNVAVRFAASLAAVLHPTPATASA